MREIWSGLSLMEKALDQHFTGALLWAQVIHDAVEKLTFIN